MVGVLVIVWVGEAVGVFVIVSVNVAVGLLVGVPVGVGVLVGPLGVGVEVDVEVIFGVGVFAVKAGLTGTEISLVQPTNNPIPANPVVTIPTSQRRHEFIFAP